MAKAFTKAVDPAPAHLGERVETDRERYAGDAGIAGEDVGHLVAIQGELGAIRWAAIRSRKPRHVAEEAPPDATGIQLDRCVHESGDRGIMAIGTHDQTGQHATLQGTGAEDQAHDLGPVGQDVAFCIDHFHFYY